MVVQYRQAAWWRKLNGVTRTAIVKGAMNPVASPVVLTEYPKSGGTWMSQMLSEALDIPYPRNRLPYWGSQIIHGCYRNISPKIDTVVVWRDGRDTMVSYYHHIFFEKPLVTSNMTGSMKQMLGVEDPNQIEDVMPRFIEWAFNGGYPGYSWSDFVNHWIDREDKVATSYEAMKENPQRELRRILDHFDRNNDMSDARIAEIVEKFSFQKQTNRKPGEEDVHSFIRKGIVGDWKNVFNREAREVFARYGGEELKRLGYEANDDWITEGKV